MVVITISKTVSRTYNLGDYENYKPSFTITKQIEIPDNSGVDINKLYLDEFAQIGQTLDITLSREREKVRTPKDG